MLFSKLKNHKGFTLVIAYSLIATLIILTSAVIFRAVNESNFVQRDIAYTQAFYLAEGALSQVAYQLGFNVANHLSINPLVVPIYTPANFTITYSLTPIGAPDQPFTENGLFKHITYYQLTATAIHQRFNTPVTLNQRICLKKAYTFQHAVFYQDDLELFPGKPMTFAGPVHCNNDIYVGSNNTTLTIDTDYFRSAASIFHSRKDTDGGGMTNSIVSILKNGTSDFFAMKIGAEQALDCDRADWTDASQTRWAGTVKSSVHGVSTLAVPVVGSVSPTGYYAQNADLKIVDGRAYNKSGTDITSSLPAGTIDDPAGPANTFMNNREGKIVTVTTIDMAKLNSSGYFPVNGLLYVTRSDATSAQPNGVRLNNGSQLASNLTVVSNTPVYIQGDYNKSGANKRSTAVICDAITLLSSNWGTGTAPNNTEVNTAFIAGIKPTPETGLLTYSGGLENYTRLLENWTGKSLTIKGSFVELWFSQIASGNWKGSYYSAPNRVWSYDTDFNDPAKLPPFTPFAVELQKIAWWKS